MLSKYFTSHHEGIVRDMHRDGHSLAEIAARLGRMPEVVAHYARGLGLRLEYEGSPACRPLPGCQTRRLRGALQAEYRGRELPRGMDG
jgi:hypothetical protein